MSDEVMRVTYRDYQMNQVPPKTVDGIFIFLGMKVYWCSMDPKTIEGVEVTSIGGGDAWYRVQGIVEELAVPLDWAYSTREAASAAEKVRSEAAKEKKP